MMMCMGAVAVVGVLWALVGYTLAFGGTTRFIGGWQYVLLNNVGIEAHGTIPISFSCRSKGHSRSLLRS